jgi:predicted nucleic acid-binding protein
VALFVDTVYLLALVNPADDWRAKALEWSGRVTEPLVTSEAVLTEVADALCRSDRRRWAVEAIRDLRDDPNVSCEAWSENLFERALDLYASRMDKDWSLTDCVSFVIMRDRHIESALTADIHFVQAGFRALLRE